MRNYAGKVDLVHLKDYRIGTLPEEAFVARSAGDHREWAEAWSNLVEFAEIGEGNLDWTGIIDAATKGGATHLLIEQDLQYGKDPMVCLGTSRNWSTSATATTSTGPGPGFQVPREWSIRPGQALGPRDSP